MISARTKGKSTPKGAIIMRVVMACPAAMFTEMHRVTSPPALEEPLGAPGGFGTPRGPLGTFGPSKVPPPAGS